MSGTSPLHTSEAAAPLAKYGPAPSRDLRRETIDADLVVVGGGLGGTCCAITAARAGIKVVLVQDRPVLGGNGSSEVRLWTLGATCHMGSSNRWAREGGVIDEILIENLYRNPEGNSLIFDTILLEKVAEEPGIRLLLNTAAYEVAKDASTPDLITGVTAFCSQNSTVYECRAPLFCDASGDGVVGFLGGAAFRMGAEKREEFNEGFAPSGEFGGLLGHSMYFYSKDTGRPVKFVAPSFAIRDVPAVIPRYKEFKTKDYGCRLWWIEYGGRLDTVHESENIKWELWRIVYGVWDYIKNSGKFPDAENLALEWVGHIPGKRESRRFEGDYILTQKDVVHRPHHDDAVAFGGWSIDLHPADGVFASIAGSHHLHSKGPYQIPFRCYYSRNIRNLFMAGRIMSSSHVAFGSTRVMGTCSHGGQAIAVAAKLCREWNCLPADISADPQKIKRLQRDLMRTGQHIWGYRLEDAENLAAHAKVQATSALQLHEFPADNGTISLAEKPWLQMLPVKAGQMPAVTLFLDANENVEAGFELRTTSRADHHCPDVVLARQTVSLNTGSRIEVRLEFPVTLPDDAMVFIVAPKNPALSVHMSTRLVSGVMCLQYRGEEKSSHVGGEDYPVFVPNRRPGAQNFALRIDPPLQGFGPQNVTNGVFRPTHVANTWVADPADASPSITLSWETPQIIDRVDLFFDVDFDHAVESVLIRHAEEAMPFCAKRYRLLDDRGTVLHECKENHQHRNVIHFEKPVETSRLTLEILEMNSPVMPATVVEMRSYKNLR